MTEPSGTPAPAGLLTPHRRYAAYSFVAVSFHAFILGLFPIHCRALGFTPFQIALISAVGTVANIIAAPTALALCHHHVGSRTIGLVFSLGALLFILPLAGLTSFIPVLAVWFAVQILRRGADSVVDAQAVRDSALGLIRFEHVRVWGSVGFVVCFALSGELLDSFGVASIIPTGILLLCLIAGAQPLLRPHLSPVPARLAARATTGVHGRSALRSPEVRKLLGSNALVWASHSALYIYFSLYLEALGWSGRMISLAWNVGVFAEILFLILFPRIVFAFSLRTIFRVSLLVATLRWVLLTVSSDPLLILGTQLLHAFSFGGCYLASTKLMYSMLPDDLRDRGQGYLVAAGTGLGSLGGRLLVGVFAQGLASYTDMDRLFLLSAALSATAFLIAPGEAESEPPPRR